MAAAAHIAGRALREAGSLPALLGRRGSLRLVWEFWELRYGHVQSFRLLRSSADGISPSVLNAKLKGPVGGARRLPSDAARARIGSAPVNRWAAGTRPGGRARNSPADQ